MTCRVFIFYYKIYDKCEVVYGEITLEMLEFILSKIDAEIIYFLTVRSPSKTMKTNARKITEEKNMETYVIKSRDKDTRERPDKVMGQNT